MACARLIGDLAVFTVETSGPALAESLRNAGFDARWVRPPGGSELAPGEVVMELRATLTGPAHRGIRTDISRTFQVRRSALDQYLIEMIEQSTWAEGMRRMLADYRLARRPLADLPRRGPDMDLSQAAWEARRQHRPSSARRE